MKSKLLLLACAALAMLSFWPASPVLAADCSNPQSEAERVQCSVDIISRNDADSGEVLENTFSQILTILNLVIAVAAGIVLVVEGLRLVLSGGKSETVNSARSGIIYALIGLAVAALSQTLIYFVINRLIEP